MSKNIKWTEKEINYIRKNYPTTSNKNIAKAINRTEEAIKRKAARLGVEKNRSMMFKHAVLQSPTQELENNIMKPFIVGVVVGEGSFIHSPKTNRFNFAIQMASCEKELIEQIHNYFGVGQVYNYKSRNEKWKDITHFQISSIKDLYTIVIPFFDSVKWYSAHKQKQYEEWKEKLLNHLNK